MTAACVLFQHGRLTNSQRRDRWLNFSTHVHASTSSTYCGRCGSASSPPRGPAWLCCSHTAWHRERETRLWFADPTRGTHRGNRRWLKRRQLISRNFTNNKFLQSATLLFSFNDHFKNIQFEGWITSAAGCHTVTYSTNDCFLCLRNFPMVAQISASYLLCNGAFRHQQKVVVSEWYRFPREYTYKLWADVHLYISGDI